MSKRFFGRCMACFFGYTKCNPAKQRISRKDKKRLKAFLKTSIAKICRSQYYDPYLNICDLRHHIKHVKPLYKFFSGYGPQLDILLNAANNACETIRINEKGRLCWEWEDDSDYGCCYGIMPFCYNEKDAGNTWAYSAVIDVFHYLYKGHLPGLPIEIKSDKDLLQFIRKTPVPTEWAD